MSGSTPQPWVHPVPGGVRISLRVQPKSSADSVDGVQNGALRIRVTAAPDKGKANARVVKLLAETLDVAPGRIRITSGEKSRNKRAEVNGVDVPSVLLRVAGAVPSKE